MQMRQLLSCKSDSRIPPAALPSISKKNSLSRKNQLSMIVILIIFIMMIMIICSKIYTNSELSLKRKSTFVFSLRLTRINSHLNSANMLLMKGISQSSVNISLCHKEQPWAKKKMRKIIGKSKIRPKFGFGALLRPLVYRPPEMD